MSDDDLPPPRIPRAAGPLLAVSGGTLYAVAALFASYAEVHGKEWTDRSKSILRTLSFMTLMSGGLCVNYALESGNPVPLMNAMVYATNLGLNMFLQIIFRVTVYTKTMRNGTILFACATVMLGEMAPPQQVPAPNIDDLVARLLMPLSIVFIIFLWVLFGVTLSLLRRVSHYPRTSSTKMMAWVIFIASMGSGSDNWAKVNGTMNGLPYTISFGIYCCAGVPFMLLSVAAMTACDVSAYVPANLCAQLCLNVLADFMVWGVAERVPKVAPYVIGYALCVLGVYILSPEADLGASITKIIEFRSGSLSRGIGKTAFGRASVNVGASWKSLKHEVPSDGAETPLSAQDAVSKLIKEGHDCKAFSQENIIELMLVLWKGNNKRLGPTSEVLSWLNNTSYFKDYFEKDPDFARIMAEGLPDGVPLPDDWPGMSPKIKD